MNPCHIFLFYISQLDIVCASCVFQFFPLCVQCLLELDDLSSECGFLFQPELSLQLLLSKILFFCSSECSSMEFQILFYVWE